MEELLNCYLYTVEELNNTFMDSSNKFKTIVVESEKITRNRYKNIRKGVAMTLNDEKLQNGKQTRPSAIRSSLLFTVNNWWDIFVQDRYPEEQCLEYFRCSRKTYIQLIMSLRPYIQPKVGIAAERHTLNMIKGVSVEKQVAIILYKLTRSSDYNTISSMFGIHKSTVHKSLYKTLQAINRHILHQNVYMPKTEEAEMIAKQFEDRCRIPQVIGAIQSLHVPIISANNFLKVLINSAGYSSAVFQCVVDSNFCFRDISIRHPGSVEQSLVLEDSKLYNSAERVIPKGIQNINGVEIPYKICGDCSYPLLPWLLTMYGLPATQSEVLYNECMAEVCAHVYEAFDRMRSRFCILSHAIDVSYKMAPQVIAACCAIHNICERNHDTFMEQWREELKDVFEKYPQPVKIVDETEPSPEDIEQRDAIRDHLETTTLLENTIYIDQDNMHLLAEEKMICEIK